MFKKIICAFLITTAMLSVTACTSNESKSNKETTDKATEAVTDVSKELAEEDIEISTEEDKQKSVNIEQMVGKTFEELLENGYIYMGCVNVEDEYFFQVSTENINDEIIDKIRNLEGKTVKDFADNEIHIWHLSSSDEEYIFNANVGNLSINFNIDGATDIIKKHQEEDVFTDIEDMTELHSMPISNVKAVLATYSVSFDDSFDASKFTKGDIFYNLKDEKEQIKDCVIAEITYDYFPENLLGSI